MSQDISWRSADFMRNTSLHLRTDYDEAIGLPTTAPAKFCVQIGLLISLDGPRPPPDTLTTGGRQKTSSDF
jgi:hypothetical protein